MLRATCFKECLLYFFVLPRVHSNGHDLDELAEQMWAEYTGYGINECLNMRRRHES